MIANLAPILDRARREATAAGGSVLDALRATAPDVDWNTSLPSSFGIPCLVQLTGLTRSEALPAPSGVPLGWRLSFDDGREVLASIDPWSTTVQAAVAASERFVEPVLVSRALADELRAICGSGGTGALQPGTVRVSSAVDFVDDVLAQAYRLGASDAHFEIDRRGLTAKLRLDGVMSELARCEGTARSEEIISRIKVLAQLDITERRLPQDGRFRYESENVGIDLRVSVMPSVFGEDAVLRLLDKANLRAEQDGISIDSLGFDGSDAAAIRRLAALPHGMLLITGPTGSGKTTSVYAALSEVNTGLEKIITIEDPVEYELAGVLQIPVNERKGLTFARGLRSILRHDPDRILVGEIRDAETAEIAVQSALTGHQVFTTIHANSLFDVVGRFRHFGLDMFGFVSALNGVVVQRLMRALCSRCAVVAQPSEAEAKWLASNSGSAAPALQQAVGCEHCRGTGYKGRFVVAEVHTVNDTLRDAIVRNADVSELKHLAFHQAATPLVRRAYEQVVSGRTSLAELFRVVGQA